MTHTDEFDAAARALREVAADLEEFHADEDMTFAIEFLRESADQYELDEPDEPEPDTCVTPPETTEPEGEFRPTETQGVYTYHPRVTPPGKTGAEA